MRQFFLGQILAEVVKFCRYLHMPDAVCCPGVMTRKYARFEIQSYQSQLSLIKLHLSFCSSESGQSDASMHCLPQNSESYALFLMKPIGPGQWPEEMLVFSDTLTCFVTAFLALKDEIRCVLASLWDEEIDLLFLDLKYISNKFSWKKIEKSLLTIFLNYHWSHW